MILPINLSYNMQNEITDLTSDTIQPQINEQFLSELLYSNDIVFLHKALIKVRNMLSSNNNIQIEETIIVKMIPHLISIIEKIITIQLTYDASWILIKITSSLQLTRQLAKFGGIELFLSFLQSNDQSILELGVWALINFSQDEETLRLCLLKNNIFQKIIEIEQKLINKQRLILLIRNLTKTSQLPHRYLQTRSCLIPILDDYIRKNFYEEENTEKKQSFIDALYSLSYISENGQQIQKILQIPGILETFKQLMAWNDLTEPTLLIIGNISTGEEEQTQAIIDCGLQKSMFERFKIEPNQDIKKTILWILSNICAGSEQQIQAVLYESDMISVIIHTIQNYENYDVVTEALYIISNSFESISEADALMLREKGVLELLQNFIQQRQDERLATIILGGLQNLVYRGFESFEQYLAEIFQEDKAWLQPLLFMYTLPLKAKTLSLICSLNQKDKFHFYENYENDENDEDDEDDEDNEDDEDDNEENDD